MTKRCNYCGRFVQKVNVNKRCLECDREFKELQTKFIRKYDSALKGLAER